MITKDNERRGIAKILSYLGNHDLNELIFTITNRMIQNFKQEERIPLILNYSQDALDFLKKKKIKKEFIFRYLNDEQVYAKSNSTKSDLIRECLKYWGSNEDYESMEIDEDGGSEDDQIITYSTESDKITSNQMSSLQTTSHIQQQYTDGRLALTSDLQTNNQMSQPTSGQINQIDDQMMQLSINFGEWFYSQLPQIDTNFNVNNFWPDSQIRMGFECNSATFHQTESGQLQVVELLRRMNQSALKFKPNLLPQFDGVRAELEQHGLLKVMIRGIIYFENQPAGWFDHIFGLIPDSNLQGHNWRIKFLDMMMKLSKPLPSIERFLNTADQNQIENC